MSSIKASLSSSFSFHVIFSLFSCPRVVLSMPELESKVSGFRRKHGKNVSVSERSVMMVKVQICQSYRAAAAFQYKKKKKRNSSGAYHHLRTCVAFTWVSTAEQQMLLLLIDNYQRAKKHKQKNLSDLSELSGGQKRPPKPWVILAYLAYANTLLLFTV